MLEQHLYATEKIRDAESRMHCAQFVEQAPSKPALAPLARPVGRALHRLGHRLEAWASPNASSEVSELTLRRKAR